MDISHCVGLDLLPEPSLPLRALKEFRDGQKLPNIQEYELPIILQSRIEQHRQRLIDFLASNEHPDIQLLIGNQKFSCQRLLLACYSNFILQYMNVSVVPLPENRLTLAGIRCVYDWMLEPAPLLLRSQVAEMLAAAIVLQVEELVQQLWRVLTLEEDFSEAQAFIIAIETSKLAGLQELEELMMRRITRCFLTLVATLEFLLLPLNSVCLLLSSDELAVNSEKEVFYAGVRWLTHNWAARSSKVSAVMSAVRFAMLPANILAELSLPLGEAAVEGISTAPGFQQQISEARFAQTLLYYQDESVSFESVFETFDMKLPKPRKFIYHSLCKYHRENAQAGQIQFSYKDFLDYMSLLQVSGVGDWQSLQPIQLQH